MVVFRRKLVYNSDLWVTWSLRASRNPQHGPMHVLMHVLLPELQRILVLVVFMGAFRDAWLHKGPVLHIFFHEMSQYFIQHV